MREGCKKLQAVFQEAGRDHGNSLSLEEFHARAVDHGIPHWLSILGLEVHEVTGLFKLLDGGDGRTFFDEFFTGVMRMRGTAKAAVLITLFFENKEIWDWLEEIAIAVLA